MLIDPNLDLVLFNALEALDVITTLRFSAVTGVLTVASSILLEFGHLRVATCSWKS
jgi:hypothetical protein